MSPINYLTAGNIDYISDYRNGGKGKGRAFLKRKTRRMVRRSQRKITQEETGE
jgi:hypothetical protein